MIATPFKFSGFGIELPKAKISNSFFETQHNCKPGYIEQNFGIQYRYFVDKETSIDLAVDSLEKALENAKCDFEDIDLLISASVSIAYQLPNNATMIAQKMKKTNVPCMDINMSCLSWLSALDFSIALLQNNTYKRIAIVSSETPSKILNHENLESQVIFGDAAVTVIIEKTNKENCGKITSMFKTYPLGWDLSIIPAGGLSMHPLHHEVSKIDYSFRMENQKLLLFSLKKMNSFFEEFDLLGTGFDEIDKIVPHQGSKAGLDFFTQQFNVKEKVIRNFETRGNCVAASIPLAFCEGILSGDIKKGEKVLLSGTAAGISIGAMLIQI